MDRKNIAGSFMTDAAPHGPEEDPKAVRISEVSSRFCKFEHKSSSQPTGSYAIHDHPFYEIVYIISGDVAFMIDDHSFRLGDHTLAAFPPGLRHGVLVDSNHPPYERYMLHFDPSCLSVERRILLQEVLPSQLFSSDQSRGEACVWRNMEHSGVLQCMEMMENLRLSPPDTVTMLLPIYLEALLGMMLAEQQRRGQPAPRRERTSTTQQDLVLWVERHFTENITLESLAERFFLSRGYVNTIFRRATGSTVKNYVLKRRMSYVQMLLSSGLPATQAAARAGFDDYTTFYRAFVRAFGHSPSKALKGVREERLAEILVPRDGPEPFLEGETIFPDNVTDSEDPSMINAVRLNAEAIGGAEGSPADGKEG